MIKNNMIFVGLVLVICAYALFFFSSFSGNHRQRIFLDRAAKQISSKIIAANRNDLFINNGYIKPLPEDYFQSKRLPASIRLQQGLYQQNRFDQSIQYSVIVWSDRDKQNQQLQYRYDTFFHEQHPLVLFAADK